MSIRRYFSGRRSIGQPIEVEGKGGCSLSCEIFEYWLNIECSATHECGATTKFSVERTVGFSREDHEALDQTIGASIGPKAIGEFKLESQRTVGAVISWQIESKVTREFQFEAPECGRRGDVIYQLIREFRINTTRRTLFGSRTTPDILIEKTHNYYAKPEIENFIESCNCKRNDVPSLDQRYVISLGAFSASAPAYTDGTESVLSFFDFNYRIPNDWMGRLALSVPMSSVPPLATFLSGSEGDVVSCYVVDADNYFGMSESDYDALEGSRLLTADHGKMIEEGLGVQFDQAKYLSGSD